MSICWRQLSLAAMTLVVFSALPVFAAETATYTYDALGRLVRVDQSGGASSGTGTALQYDPAGNRSNVTVTGATTSGGSTPNNYIMVVLPRLGLTTLWSK